MSQDTSSHVQESGVDCASRVSTRRRDLRYVSPPGASGESHGPSLPETSRNPRTDRAVAIWKLGAR